METLITVLLIMGMFTITTSKFSFSFSLLCNTMVIYLLWTNIF